MRKLSKQTIQKGFDRRSDFTSTHCNRTMIALTPRLHLSTLEPYSAPGQRLVDPTVLVQDEFSNGGGGCKGQHLV